MQTFNRSEDRGFVPVGETFLFPFSGSQGFGSGCYSGYAVLSDGVEDLGIDHGASKAASSRFAHVTYRRLRFTAEGQTAKYVWGDFSRREQPRVVATAGSEPVIDPVELTGPDSTL